ncbi:hypothetical protein LTR10_003900 [Elasticomyces elasticus]|nr:hypothetical protein LTR10_003900 [Elasticomyces elasticus]
MYLVVLYALLQVHLSYARFSNSNTLALSSNSSIIRSSSGRITTSYSGSSINRSDRNASSTIVFSQATTSSLHDDASPLSQVPAPSPSDGTSYLANETSLHSFGTPVPSYQSSSSSFPDASNATLSTVTKSIAASSTSAHNFTPSSVIPTPSSTNTPLGMSISASTLAGNKTSPASTNTTITPNNTTDWTWAKWSPLAYPTDCNAYYTASLASPSATPWSALANAASLFSAWNCFSSLASYSSISNAWGASNIIYQLSTRSYVYSLTTETDTIPFTSYQLTTLCDGLPRVVTGLNASSTIGVSTASQTYGDGSTYVQTLTTATSALPFTTPPPTCSLDCAGCSMVSAAAYYSSSSYAAAGDQEAAASVLIPYDCPSPPLPDTDDGGAAECAVMIQSAQMYYWPVTVINGDLCNKTGTTITPNPTGSGPNTIDIGSGITLVRTRLSEMSIDCRLNELYKPNGVHQLLQPVLHLPRPKHNRFRGNHGGSGTYSVNYGDLPPNPVPSSAWFGQVECFNGVSTCLPIGTTAYKPDLVWPPIFSDISSLNPKWTAKSCSLGIEFDGVWDPPSALQPASTVDGPSTPVPTVVPTTSSNRPESTPASPSSTPPSGPVQTTASASSRSTSFTVIAESTKPVVSGSSDHTKAADSSTPQDLTQPTASTHAADSTPVASPTNPVVTSKSVSDGPGQPTRSYAPALAYSESRLDTPGVTITSKDAGGIIASVLGIPPTSSMENASRSQISPDDPVQADPGAATTHVPGYSLASGYATVTSLASATLLASVHASGGVVIDGTTFSPGQTLSPGGPAASVKAAGIVLDGKSTLVSAQAIIGDQTFSAASSGLVMGGQTVMLSAKTLQTAVINADGSQIVATQLGSGSVTSGQMTISIGGPAATFGGKTLSAASGGLIVDGSIAAFSTDSQGTSIVAFGLDPKTALVTAGSSTYTAIEQPSSVVIAGKTLIVGGPALTFDDGQIVSEAVGSLVIGAPSGAHDIALRTAIVNADHSAHTAIELGSGTVVLDGKTLTIGGAALTLGSGEVFSEASGGLLAVEPSHTRTVAFQTEQAAIITAGSSTYTAFELDPGTVVLKGHTLTAGGSAITLGGHIFSEGPTGLFEDGTSTIAVTSSSANTVSPTISSPVSGDPRPPAPSRSSSLSSRSQLKLQGLWLPLLLFLMDCS